MKNLIAPLVIAFLFTACGHSAKKQLVPRESISKNLIVDQIAAETFVVKDLSFYNSNILIAKMPDETVVIASSPIETVKTKMMLDWIQKTLKPKKLIAINTHFHADGTGGNEAYHNAHVEIWSSVDTDRIYQARADKMQKGLAKFVNDLQLGELVLKRKNLPADKTFDAKKGMEWTFGNEKVIVSFPGPAHTSDNIVVYFPKRKVLFGGCILRALDWNSLGNLEDADVDKYFSSVETLLKFDADIVIPGHGNIGNKKLIHHTMSLAKKAPDQK